MDLGFIHSHHCIIPLKYFYFYLICSDLSNGTRGAIDEGLFKLTYMYILCIYEHDLYTVCTIGFHLHKLVF